MKNKSKPLTLKLLGVRGALALVEDALDVRHHQPPVAEDLIQVDVVVPVGVVRLLGTREGHNGHGQDAQHDAGLHFDAGTQNT